MAERKTGVDESQTMKDSEEYKRIATSHHGQPEYKQNCSQVEMSKLKQTKQKHKEPTGRKRSEKKKVIESGDVEIRELMFKQMVAEAEATKQSKLQQSSAHSKTTIRALTEDPSRHDSLSDKVLAQHTVSYSTKEALINRNNTSGGNVLVQSTVEDTSNERPPFTTKAESLSRELSPSRITAQMQSVLSESYRPTSQSQTTRQNLLHSALTGMLSQSPGRVSPPATKTSPKPKAKAVSAARLPPKKEIPPGMFRESEKSPPDHIVRTAKLPSEMNQSRSVGRSSPKFLSEQQQHSVVMSGSSSLHSGSVGVSLTQTHEHHHLPPAYTSGHVTSIGPTSVTVPHSFNPQTHWSKLGMVVPTSAITSTRVAPGVHIVAAPPEGIHAVPIPHHLQKVIVPISGESSRTHSPSREVLLSEHESDRRYSPHAAMRRTPPPIPPVGWISTTTSSVQQSKPRVSALAHQASPPQGQLRIPSPHRVSSPHRVPSPHRRVPSPIGSLEGNSPSGNHGYVSPQRGHSPYTVRREPVSHQDRSSPFREPAEGHPHTQDTQVMYRQDQPMARSSPSQHLRDQQSSPLSAGFRPQGSAGQGHRSSPDHQVKNESLATPPPAHIAFVQKLPEKTGVLRTEQAVDLTKVHKYTTAAERKTHNPLSVPPYVEGLMALSGHNSHTGKGDSPLSDVDHVTYTSANLLHPVTNDVMKFHQSQSLPHHPAAVAGAVTTLSTAQQAPTSETVAMHPVSTHTGSKHHSRRQPISVQSKGPLPPHVNPFTFPTSIKVTAVNNALTVTHSVKSEQSDSVLPKEHSPMLGPFLSQINTGSRLSPQSDKDGGNEMPRLVPEVSLSESKESVNKYSDFNHVDESSNQLQPLENPFNMRLQNLSNFPASNMCRTGFRAQSVAVLRAKTCSITSAAKSLDLLRQNLQKSINKDIDKVIQSYIEKYFNPGIANIKLNNGPNAVSEDHVHSVCRQILEEAKRMYCVERRSVTPVHDISDNVSESGSTNGRRSASAFVRKRRPSDSNSESGKNEIVAPKKKRKGRPPLNQTGRGTPSKLMRSEPLRQGPKWDPERLTAESLFVMGARANKALGLGNTRGRLYIKHPDVFKYSGDQDDKAWLYERQLMPVTGGKAYMLLVEDIRHLSETDEYRDSPNLMMDELKGFTVPEFMIHKMKAEMLAQRTDSGRSKFERSRSGTPVEDRESKECLQDLPFSSLNTPSSSGDVKSESRVSPGGTEEMEILSTADNEEQNGQDLSPMNMTSAFEDAGSRSPADLDSYDGDPQLPASFTLNK